ncbi:MAG TPA: DedA family protein [Candidatus Aminicenantes bacterium]|nr:DedA family protein [Candidatus Aminicenantes bacterium]
MNLRENSKNFWRPALFLGQVTFVLFLLILWLTWTELRTSRSLWVLFFYSFPSEFLVAVVPHEPVLLYFARFYSPATVAFIAASSTLLTEALNYSVFSYVSDWTAFQKFQQKKAIQKLINLFNHAPFLAIWIAAFTPIPFYPFRFLVVMASYSRWKFLLALALSRTPRFFLLAWFGHQVHLSDELLILLFVILIVGVNIGFLRQLLRKFFTRKKAGKETYF